MIKCLNNPDVKQAVSNVANRLTIGGTLQGMVSCGLMSVRGLRSEISNTHTVYACSDFGDNAALLEAIETLLIQVQTNIANQSQSSSNVADLINAEYTNVLISKDESATGKAVAL